MPGAGLPMTSYIRTELRRFVEERARHLCEYCLIHKSDTYLGCQVDHVISEKHGGPTEADNLAYACTLCNRAKGSDIASLAASSGAVTRLFNPRRDRWSEHFMLDGDLIKPLTPVGEATVLILDFNAELRRLERQLLRSLGRYPTEEASEIIFPRGE